MSEEILAFTTEHLDACANVFVEVFKDEPWNEHWTQQTAKMRLLETLNTPGFIGFVLRHNEVLGFVVGYYEQWWDDSKHFYVKEICVRPGRQHQGIGTKLLHQLMNTLATMNVTLIYLLTIKEGQTEPFFVKNGYQRSPKMIFMSHRL